VKQIRRASGASSAANAAVLHPAANVAIPAIHIKPCDHESHPDALFQSHSKMLAAPLSKRSNARFAERATITPWSLPFGATGR
jgi:hypothetical protein